MNDNDYYNNGRGGDLPFFEDTHRAPDYGRDGARDGAVQNAKQQPSPYGGGLYPQSGRSGDYSRQAVGRDDYTPKSTKNFNNLMVYSPGKSGFGSNYKTSICRLYKLEDGE